MAFAVERDLNCLANLQEVGWRFNQLFNEVSSMDRKQLGAIQKQSTLTVPSIDKKRLTNDQMEAIKCMGGYLSSCLQYFKEKLNRCDNVPAGAAPAVDIEGDEEYKRIIAEKLKIERRDRLTIATLQDYLIHEVTRNEHLEEKYQKIEEELVAMTAERNKYQKLLEKRRSEATRLAATATASTHSSETLKQLDPSKYFGMYVRKNFGTSFYFGVVISYDAPYFKVVYEDADEEELGPNELFQLLWTTSVPSAKIAQCQRHATVLQKKLGLDVKNSFKTDNGDKDKEEETMKMNTNDIPIDVDDDNDKNNNNEDNGKLLKKGDSSSVNIAPQRRGSNVTQANRSGKGEKRKANNSNGINNSSKRLEGFTQKHPKSNHHRNNKGIINSRNGDGDDDNNVEDVDSIQSGVIFSISSGSSAKTTASSSDKEDEDETDDEVVLLSYPGNH